MKRYSELTKQRKIDEIDEKILRTLLKESRTSFTEIAKDCKISINSVRKRYTRLWKAGIINGAITQVDPASLGYTCIATIWIATAIEDEGRVMEFLRSKPYCCAVFRNIFARANIAAIVSLHEFEELSKTVKDIESHPNIKHTVPLIWNKTSGIDYSENLTLTPSTSKTINKIRPKPSKRNLEKVKFEKTDRQIAKMLSKNSRASFTKIAQKLNISTKNVTQRYKKLRRTVLASSTITVSLEKLGFNAMVLLHMKVADRSKTSETVAKLLQIPNLIIVLEYVGGEYDLFVNIVLRDYDDLFEVEKQFSTINNIEQVDMFLSAPYPSWPLNFLASLL
ncbi:MAG: Lrp/AsnC family transcriptional regulator [Candidatus Bathyarchaeia archaeon]|nr:Lrp/AsnC family transcriptional regulator [Candidatus Bathyarchaeia archaeon]